MRISENFTAATPKTFNVPGNYFHLDSLPGGTVDVSFFRNGKRLAEELRGVVAGWWASPEGGFDALEVTSSLTQAVAFYAERGRVGANVFSGSVVVTNATENAAHISFAAAVSNVSVQLVGAAAARKFLSIQNHHATANLFVRGDSIAAELTPACVRVPPGQLWAPKVPPTGAVFAMMDLATAGNTVNVIASAL